MRLFLARFPLLGALLADLLPAVTATLVRRQRLTIQTAAPKIAEAIAVVADQ